MVAIPLAIPYSTKCSQFSLFLLELRMFFGKFQSLLSLVDVILMQTQKIFRKHSHGDLIAKVLALKRFMLYGNRYLQRSYKLWFIASLQ